MTSTEHPRTSLDSATSTHQSSRQPRTDPRQGRLAQSLRLALPAGPSLRHAPDDRVTQTVTGTRGAGQRMAGQVEAVGRKVSRFRAGDEVYAQVGTGGCAEHINLPQEQPAPKPSNLTTDPRKFPAPRTSLTPRGTDLENWCPPGPPGSAARSRAAYGLLTAVMITMALAASLLVLPSLLMLVTRDRVTTPQVEATRPQPIVS